MASATHPRRKRKTKARRKFATVKNERKSEVMTKAKAAAKGARRSKGRSGAKREALGKSKVKTRTKSRTKTRAKTQGKSVRWPKAKTARKAKTRTKPSETKLRALLRTKSKARSKAKPKTKSAPKTKPASKAVVTPQAANPVAAPSPAPERKPELAVASKSGTHPPHLFAAMLTRVHAACAAVLGPAADLSRVLVEPPRDPSHGDMAANAAMVLAKDAGQKPRDLAEKIAEILRGEDHVASVTVAGPGFINLTLKPQVWSEALRAALTAGRDYGRSALGRGQKVNIEYVSANPTGPMHVGHCRGAVFGDALAKLLAFAGYKVTREYYINDAGAQVDVLARSSFLRYREALGEAIGEIPDGLYPGEYLREVGGELAADYGFELTTKPEAEWLLIVRERAINIMMAGIRNDLMRLNVVPDVYFSERSLIEGEEPDSFSPHPPPERKDVVAKTIEWLRDKGLVYEGRLPPPKSGAVEDWEDREQTLFRSTQFGDDVDRPLKKSDGTYTYFATDIAYHKSKLDRGFDHLIDVWGADHGGYVKRMQAAVKALSNGKGDLDVKLVQLVRLLRAGEPVKMSKRAGEFVTLREVVEEVGKDAVRFDMLFRKNDAALDFDLAKVIEHTRENPVFYVQYGHARGRSVLRHAHEAFPELRESVAEQATRLRAARLDLLSDEGEMAILRRIALYPRTVEAAAQAHEPHRIAFYLYDLASEFHAFWTRGKDLPHLRFIIQDDRETTMARLALVEGIVIVLASGLALLGVEAPEEMR